MQRMQSAQVYQETFEENCMSWPNFCNTCMFQNLCRSRMPVSLSEWRVRIGTYVRRMLKYHNLVRYLTQLRFFLALLKTLADGESNVDPSDLEEQEMGSTSTTEHQSPADKTPSKPEKQDSFCGDSYEQETPTATSDNTKSMPCKTSKKRKHHSQKGRDGCGRSAFLSFRCFMKSGASPLLRFLLLVFTTILLVRSGDVEMNPGPNETTVPDGTLLDIAKRIPQNKMYDLGVKLGVDLIALMRYHATNTLGGAVDYSGTLHMLVDWRDKTTMEQQKELLRNALNASSLQAVAEEYLPEASRANPSSGTFNLKRTASGTPVQSAQVPMDSTSSSNASLTIPSTSGHTSTFVPQNPSVPSTNCINPITDTQLEKCIADIQDYYRVHLCQISTSPLDSDSIVELQSIFTNLSLVKEDRNRKKKIPLKYEKLLNVDINGKPARCIMIQGEAGVGKTTFCAKIAWDWVSGERYYQDYTLVAVVPLRDANNGKTVGQVLKTYLSDDNDVTSEQLDKYIRNNQQKVLTVFDGFDEFSVEMSNKENQIVQILKGKRQISGRVIITTRPWRAQEITCVIELTKQYALVNIEGFKKRDVKTYVNKFYQNDKTSALTLLEYMEEGSLIAETMAPFPIFCSMLCHLWKEVEHREVIRKLQTFSQLFQEMIVLLKQHYVSKRTDEVDGDSVEKMGESINGHFKKISEVAFNGLLDKQLVFQEERFDSCVDDLRVACEVGILTKERTKRKRDESVTVRKLARWESTVSFPHKLFQEYIAGLYLRDLCHSNNVEFNHQMKSHILKRPGEFKDLLYFVGSFDEEIAKYVVTKLMAQRRRTLNLIVEVAFECHSEEAANLVEAKHPEINHQLTIEKGTSRHVIAGYIFTFKHLVSLCVETFCSSKALCRIIADTVCSLETLKELEIKKCNFIEEFIKSMQDRAEAVMVESLDIFVGGMSASASQNLGACICAMPCLKNLKLSGELSDGLHNALRDGASSLKVESLQIDDHDISESASQNLGASICAMPCLKDVKLSGNLSDGFYSALREGALLLNVESLKLHVNDISVHGSQSLGASICSMPCLRSVNVLSSGHSAESKITLRKDVGRSSSSSSSEVISSPCQINIDMNGELLIAFVSSLASSQTPSVQVISHL